VHSQRVLGAGLTMAVATGLFAYGGYLLDGVVGTLPLFLIVGTLLGFVGGSIHLLAAVAPEMLPFGKRRRSGPPPSRPNDTDPSAPD
jgi:F0F1-type ATP synthase assembly protein I